MSKKLVGPVVSDAELARRRRHEELILGGLVHSCLIGAMLYPLWYPIDLVILQRNQELLASEFLGFDRRLICAVIRGVVLFLLFGFVFIGRARQSDPDVVRRLILVGSWMQFVMGFGIVLLTYVLDQFLTNYHSGLIMVFIAITILVPWHPIRTVAHLFLLAVAYVVLAAVRGVPFDDMPVWTNMVFVFGAAIVCGYGVFVLNSLGMGYGALAPPANGRRREARGGWAKGLWAKAWNFSRRYPDLAFLCVGVTILLAALVGVFLKVTDATGNNQTMVIITILCTLLGPIIGALIERMGPGRTRRQAAEPVQQITPQPRPSEATGDRNEPRPAASGIVDGS